MQVASAPAQACIPGYSSTAVIFPEVLRFNSAIARSVGITCQSFSKLLYRFATLKLPAVWLFIKFKRIADLEVSVDLNSRGHCVN
jgi:hypothetical protein